MSRIAWTVWLVLALGAAHPATAQSTESELQEVVRAFHGEGSVVALRESLRVQIAHCIEEVGRATLLSEPQRTAFEKESTALHERLIGGITWASVKPVVMARYREALNDAEIHALLEMIRSPAWATYAAKVETVNAQLVASVMSVSPQILRAADQSIRRSLEAILKQPSGSS